ncbi:MAG: DUF1684 domain-containing protein [Saprospiraceae bacterium]
MAQTDFKKAIKNHRAEYKQAFLMEKGAPLDSAGVQNIRFFRPKKAYQVEASFTLLKNKEPFEMPTYDGKVQPYIAYGKLNFVLGRDSLELTIYRSLRFLRMPMFRDKLFLPFKDQTNARSTYGGGRYLDFKIGDIHDGKLTLDFNKAYNPYCAFSDGYSCPIPPFENHLLVKVKAGEKAFRE